ncbi:MAG TPA: DUF4238 domain-containing protein, partial [Gaiellaceae bacterium]|nr:DUF4238 domain-containing protein [Gaiellaceae bacterium]
MTTRPPTWPQNGRIEGTLSTDEQPKPTIYSNVKNAHIVPRTYLERWSVGRKIAVVQVREDKRIEMAVENVGTRRHFYRRDRPDGSTIDDMEWMLC